MKSICSTLVAALAVCFLTLAPSPAQEKSVRPGINKPFENPDLKDFILKFEAESREIAAHAKEIVAACKLKPGMVVADVGAGTGLFTRKFAAEVGEKGKVFAVDIAPTFQRYIEKTCQESNIKNVKTVLCDQFSTKLPRNSVDLVFICDTYHHFEFPQKTLKSIHDALRPGGQVVLIDFHRIQGKSSDFVLGHVRAGQEVFVREITTAGFKVVGDEKFLKENYFVRFEKKEQPQQGNKEPGFLGAKYRYPKGETWTGLSAPDVEALRQITRDDFEKVSKHYEQILGNAFRTGRQEGILIVGSNFLIEDSKDRPVQMRVFVHCGDDHQLTLVISRANGESLTHIAIVFRAMERGK